MVDSHCHLTDPRLFDQLDDVLARAASAGVERVVTIGTNSEDDQACVELCRRHANVRCAIGLHPNYVNEEELSRLGGLRGLHLDPTVLALGEMGLDYHYDYAPRDLQREAFEWQLQLARESRKPVVIHCREAVDDTLAVLTGFPGVPAVFHCFTGTPGEARRILDAGHLIGLTGVVTYKNSDPLREVARLVPDDRLLVETDAPYLSPEPVRKVKTNEPAFVTHTAGVVARERGISLEALDRMTTRNVERFFGWKR